ncbi:MAG: prolyl oligopeptidase family serine peptidase, partial [Cyanobacteria bacterium]|nr:prolyl oligopeptidase family serine peptidase [Cyanobacteriota bacterium]
VDVNYGGSTGFGRDYRQRLRNNWGVVDNQDAVNAARHLVKKGLADPKRLIITGMSAGGYATICGVTFYDDFACGSAQFGVSDMEKMAQLFHKFQSRFLQTMIAPYPERADVYRSRSAVNYIDQIKCPLLLLHGQLDTIVPIEQSEQLAQLLDAAKKPFSYVKFDDEPHVFRKAENVKKTMEGELYFYASVLGFKPADALPGLEIKHRQTDLAPSPRS